MPAAVDRAVRVTESAIRGCTAKMDAAVEGGRQDDDMMSSIHQEAAEEGVATTRGTKREGSSTQKSAQRQRAAEKKGVWSLVEFRSVITDKLVNAAEIFGASADQMATLLAVQPKIQFNIDKLTDGDRYEELAEAVEKLQTGTSQQLTGGAAGAGPTMCVACLEQEAIGLAGCGREHIVLCGPCAASYVESKMDESAGLPAVGISCPQVGCVERIDLSQCEQLLEKLGDDGLAFGVDCGAEIGGGENPRCCTL